ncbi:MAG TPA: methyltransferase domain-containing protein [Bacteroidia bacterium]|nr:methyltransferase domain-containing protein [Bacteroidia bacterium]
MPQINYDEFAESFSLQLANHLVKVSRIKDIDKLFDRLLSKPAADVNVLDERMPYWADLWPSAIGLSKYIDENPSLVHGKIVIEIGCGLGLPGIVAALNGAEVTMTDYLQEALDFSQNNWNKNLSVEFNGQLLDWRDVSKIEKADVILASDVAYESRSFEPLLAALKHILKPDGVLLLSEPNRKFASPFIKILENEFNLKKSDRKVTLDGIDYVISIYEGKKTS